MSPAMTVLGPVEVEMLGSVLMHEHLLHDDVAEPAWFLPGDTPAATALAEANVHAGILGELHRCPLVCRDNTRLTRRDPIADELGRFRDAGGGTVVELTVRGLAPDPAGLAALSRATGVHVVAGCGWYVDHTLPHGLVDRPVDDLADELVRDLSDGIDGTSVRAGIIGEVGTSMQITAAESRSLRSAGRAAARTGAAVMVHLAYTGQQAFAAFDILREEGVDADRIVMNHMDEARDLDYVLAVAALGCVVEYDTFGSEWHYDNWSLREPTDAERVGEVAALCSAGLADRVTLAHDVFYKQSLRAFGGYGYDHIARTIVPALRCAGVTDSDLHQMLVDTPHRLLTLPDQQRRSDDRR